MASIYSSGGLWERVENVQEKGARGELTPPPEGYLDDPSYIPAFERPSAYRQNAPEALMDFYDVMDKMKFPNTQYNAPDGVLNPDSPTYRMFREYAELQPRLQEYVDKYLKK